MATTSTRGEASLERQAEFLRKKRKHRLDGMSIAEAARQISTLIGKSFSGNNIGHFESGRRRAEDRYLVLLALVYGNITPEEYEHELGRPDAAERLSRELEARAAGTPSPSALTTAVEPRKPATLPWDELKAQIDRQVAQLGALAPTEAARLRMEEALFAHYKGVLDLNDAQLGVTDD